MNDSALDAAYRRASYWFVGPSGDRLRITCDERCEPLDRILDEARATDWAYVTACNPRSRRLSVAENRDRAARLEGLIRDRGLLALPGEGTGEDPDWPPEPSLLVLGMPEHEAVALGRVFDQNAIVVGSRGAAARLVWIDAPPAGVRSRRPGDESR